MLRFFHRWPRPNGFVPEGPGMDPAPAAPPRVSSGSERYRPVWGWGPMVIHHQGAHNGYLGNPENLLVNAYWYQEWNMDISDWFINRLLVVVHDGWWWMIVINDGLRMVTQDSCHRLVAGSEVEEEYHLADGETQNWWQLTISFGVLGALSPGPNPRNFLRKKVPSRWSHSFVDLGQLGAPTSHGMAMSGCWEGAKEPWRIHISF